MSQIRHFKPGLTNPENKSPPWNRPEESTYTLCRFCNAPVASLFLLLRLMSSIYTLYSGMIEYQPMISCSLSLASHFRRTMIHDSRTSPFSPEMLARFLEHVMGFSSPILTDYIHLGFYSLTNYITYILFTHFGTDLFYAESVTNNHYNNGANIHVFQYTRAIW